MIGVYPVDDSQWGVFVDGYPSPIPKSSWKRKPLDLTEPIPEGWPHTDRAPKKHALTWAYKTMRDKGANGIPRQFGSLADAMKIWEKEK